MPKWTKQAEAASYIIELLIQRGFDIPSRQMPLEDNQHWTVFQHGERHIGIDSASGVWVRASIRDEWHCLSMPCTVSGALKAVEFLIKD
jgi:hypothetical protein